MNNQLENLVTFTSELVEQMEQVNYSDLQTDDESLADVVKTTREYILKRKQNLSINTNFADSEKADVDEIRARIQDWKKRTTTGNTSNFAETEKADVDEIKDNIQNWLRRTRKVING